MPVDDDDVTPAEPEDDPEAGDEEAEVDLEAEPDAEALGDVDEEFTLQEDEDEAVVEATEEEEEEEDEESDEAPTTRTKRRAGEEEEDEDDELLSPDDVEADLDRILKDRLVTAEEEDEDEEEPDERGDTGDRLQPKRADEQLCPNCFLLVRSTAPNCPVGDDACPIFG